MKITQLKGGSLSLTTLHEECNSKFVRKTVNTKQNREYGFVRWYSQLKKLQKFYETGLFPKVLNVGYEHDTAYFDIEYLDGYKDIKTIFSNDILSYAEIEKINESIWISFEKLHKKIYTPNVGSSALYFREEVVQKFFDSLKYKKFSEVYESSLCNVFEYNGQVTYGIENYLPQLESFFNKLQFLTEENIHGNPTLENIMYSFDENKVMFVDPYEENCIDVKTLDYSQVLQCSRSYYGYINDHNVTINENSISFFEKIPQNFKIFNEMFESRINNENRKVVNILEATQFIRMLPFKCAVDEIDKAIFFYAHACHLLGKIFDGKRTNSI